MATKERGFAAMSESDRKKYAREGGKKSGGNFKNDPKRASVAASNSGGNFKHDPERAKDAGRKSRSS